MSEMRLIDAKGLEGKAQRMYAEGEAWRIAPDAYRAVLLSDVRRAPTIDAVPVVHGRWIYGVTLNHEWRKCSECLVSQEIFGCFTYCPNCGAKMDGGASDG